MKSIRWQLWLCFFASGFMIVGFQNCPGVRSTPPEVYYTYDGYGYEAPGSSYTPRGRRFTDNDRSRTEATGYCEDCNKPDLVLQARDFAAIAETITGTGDEEGFGACVHQRDKIPRSKYKRHGDAYNDVINYWNSFRETPDIKYKGKPMTRAQMRTVDGLARTIYGEMASCVKNGQQYPYGVAAVIRNRALASQCGDARSGQFVGVQDPQKTMYERALSAPKQFSVWNYNDKALALSFCPQTNIPAWKTILNISKQMVMEPESFDEATKYDFNCVYNYVSGPIENRWTRRMTEVSGGSVEKKSCMRRFVEPGTDMKTCDMCPTANTPEEMSRTNRALMGEVP